MASFKTPKISKMRTSGGTFITFGSATEDIGLNINERNNKVSLSNYVLLNIPDMSTNAGTTKAFNPAKIVTDHSTLGSINERAKDNREGLTLSPEI